MEYGSQTARPGETLADDVNNAAMDAGEAIKASGQQLGDQMGERYRSTRARVQEGLSQAKNNLSDMQKKASVRTRDAADTADQFVKEHPWQSVGIGAVAGLVVGFLMMRR